MPHVQPLQGKLWELRSHGPSQQHRVIYVAISGQRLLLLHAFTKKTAQTPRREIALAEERLADWEQRRQKTR
jgi:phage-related protein